MFAGHMDEVGFMVTDIEPSGYLRLRPLGGWWPHVLLGHRVTVRTRKGDFMGIIGSKPPHELEAEERKNVVKMEDLFVDLGSSAGFDIVGETGVRRGDFVVPYGPFTCATTASICRDASFSAVPHWLEILLSLE